jgi:hypothetical protein
MNREEARRLLGVELDQLEQLGYERLAARIGEVTTYERPAATGGTYQLELQLFWDGRPNGAIRLLGSIDDGGPRALLPLTDSRIVQPQQ